MLEQNRPEVGDLILTLPDPNPNSTHNRQFFVVDRKLTGNRLEVIPVVADGGFVKLRPPAIEIDLLDVLIVYPRKR